MFLRHPGRMENFVKIGATSGSTELGYGEDEPGKALRTLLALSQQVPAKQLS